MKVTALLLELQAHGVILTVADGQLAMKGKTAPPKGLLEAAKVHKADIITALKVFSEQASSSNPALSGALETPFDEQDTPHTARTLEDFRRHGCYPSISNGTLRLLTAAGEPIYPLDPTGPKGHKTDAGIITAWQAAKDTIQAQLEARHATLTAWAETLLSDLGRVYLYNLSSELNSRHRRKCCI